MTAADGRAGLIALCLAIVTGAGPAPAAGLPENLPALPTVGETMLRDLVSGLALRGYDPVAYRLAGVAVAGRAEFELSLEGLVWRFSSAANRAAFQDAPALYAPRFAGFDAASVGAGRVVDADPRRFAIVDGALHLFRSDENRSRYLADAALRVRALKNWPALQERLAQ